MSTTDSTDLALLRLLAEDATLSSAALGARLGLSQPAAWRRIRRLEESGVIVGRRIEFDLAALGFGVTVFLGVKLAARGGWRWSISNGRSRRSPRCRRSSTYSVSTITAFGWWPGIWAISSGC